jgi:predicted dehydrogenase
VRGAPRKVAVIGCGRQGRTLLDELRKIDAFEVAAVCDPLPTRVRAAQERAAGAAGFSDHRALLDERPDIEAVFIATPTHLHRAPAVDALGAGRHVYCEAPLAATAADCAAILTAAASARGVFQAGFQARSNPICKRAWSLVRSDTVRDLVSLYAQHHRKTSWRFPAPDAALERATNWRLDPDVSLGLAGELGVHSFDAMSWFRGRAPTAVSGSGAIRLHHDGRRMADTVSLMLDWEDGVRMTYSATLANSYGGEHEVLYGSNGAVRLAGTHGWMFKEADAATQGWEVYATRQQFPGEEGIVLLADATQLAAQGRLGEGAGLPHPALYYAVEDFARSITEGAPVACTAEDGVAASLIGIAAARAVAEGTTVQVSAG